MTRNPRAFRPRKRDENEPVIIAALKAVGAKVHKLDGTGLPDLLVGWGCRTFLLEVKMPLGPRGGSKDRDLTDDQQIWWASWKGAPPAIVRSEIEALTAIGAIARKAMP